MSSAARLARWNSRSRNWAGQDRVLGQRQSTSPSSRSSSVPHAGHRSGNTYSYSSPVRRSATGPTISGITSPALRSTTMSPIRTPLRLISSALCSVALVTVDPATWTASMIPNGVTRPVRPVLTSMRSSRVVTSSGGVLVRDRPSRCPAGRAERALLVQPVDLDHDAVDLVRRIVPVLAVIGDIRAHVVQIVDDLDQVTDRQAPLAKPLIPARLGVRRARGRGLPGLGHPGGTRVAARHREPVHDQAERPARRDLRVLLPQRP